MCFRSLAPLAQLPTDWLGTVRSLGVELGQKFYGLPSTPTPFPPGYQEAVNEHFR